MNTCWTPVDQPKSGTLLSLTYAVSHGRCVVTYTVLVHPSWFQNPSSLTEVTSSLNTFKNISNRLCIPQTIFPLVLIQIFLTLQELPKLAWGWLGNHRQLSIQWVPDNQTAKGQCEKSFQKFWQQNQVSVILSVGFIMWEGGLKVSVSGCLPNGKWFCLESHFHDGITLCCQLPALLSPSVKWEQQPRSALHWGKNGGYEREAISLKDKVSFPISSSFCVRYEKDETLFKMSTNWRRAI